MKEDLQENLFNKYPELFSRRFLSSQETRMCDGICCGDNWYFIIDNLCSCIQRYLKIKNFGNEEKNVVHIDQIKTKFGVLCFYLHRYDVDKEIRGMISLASHMSKTICQYCGEEKHENVIKHKCSKEKT